MSSILWYNDAGLFQRFKMKGFAAKETTSWEILNYFGSFKLKEFSIIEDDGFEKGIIINADPTT